jgi:hypothetical protein
MNTGIRRHAPSRLAARLFSTTRKQGEAITSGMFCLQLNTAWAVWATTRAWSPFAFQCWTTYDAVRFGGLALAMGWAFDYTIACWPASFPSSEPPPYEGAMCYDYVPDTCFDPRCPLCRSGRPDDQERSSYAAVASPAALMRVLRRGPGRV